jgi:hypothetical protein
MILKQFNRPLRSRFIEPSGLVHGTRYKVKPTDTHLSLLLLFGRRPPFIVCARPRSSAVKLPLPLPFGLVHGTRYTVLRPKADHLRYPRHLRFIRFCSCPPAEGRQFLSAFIRDHQRPICFCSFCSATGRPDPAKAASAGSDTGCRIKPGMTD